MAPMLSHSETQHNHSQLCARVTDAQYLHGNTYAITCTRYRDGTGSTTYEVNLDTGQAR